MPEVSGVIKIAKPSNPHSIFGLEDPVYGEYVRTQPLRINPNTFRTTPGERHWWIYEWTGWNNQPQKENDATNLLRMQTRDED